MLLALCHAVPGRVITGWQTLPRNAYRRQALRSCSSCTRARDRGEQRRFLAEVNALLKSVALRPIPGERWLAAR